jgi:hypothetical protein
MVIVSAGQARMALDCMAWRKPVVELSKLHADLLMFEEQAGIAAARQNVLLARAPDAPIGPLTEPTEHTLLPVPTELQRLALEHQPELQRAHVETRLRPKLMTVSVVMGALVPILSSTGVGSDIMKPIAAPIIGGMATSTIHVLIITAVIFYLMKTRALRRCRLRASGMHL